MRLIHFFLFITACFLSCEEASDWNFNTGENGQLVVDAIITNEMQIQEVQLSLSYDDLNGIPTPISDATVLINNGQNDFLFAEAPNTPGKYISPPSFRCTNRCPLTN